MAWRAGSSSSTRANSGRPTRPGREPGCRGGAPPTPTSSKGLVQVAAGCYHYQRRNRHGAEVKWHDGGAFLRPYLPKRRAWTWRPWSNNVEGLLEGSRAPTAGPSWRCPNWLRPRADGHQPAPAPHQQAEHGGAGGADGQPEREPERPSARSPWCRRPGPGLTTKSTSEPGRAGRARRWPPRGDPQQRPGSHHRGPPADALWQAADARLAVAVVVRERLGEVRPGAEQRRGRHHPRPAASDAAGRPSVTKAGAIANATA